jgi:hypothetical protein
LERRIFAQVVMSLLPASAKIFVDLERCELVSQFFTLLFQHVPEFQQQSSLRHWVRFAHDRMVETFV